MASIHETITIDADPARVWELAGEPERIAEWLPGIARSSVDAARRSCALEAGGDIEERILERSDEERFYEYEILESPMPLRSYRSRFSVAPDDGHAHVEWRAEFAPDAPEQEQELTEMLSGLYRDGLESLRERLESPQGA